MIEVFWLKKLAGGLLSPFLVALGLTTLGVAMGWGQRWRGKGRWISSAGVILLVCLSYGIPTQWALSRLESMYPPVVDPAVHGDVEWLVVLGGGHSSNPGTPVTNWIGSGSLRRLAEGVRLYGLMDNAHIVVSGAAIADDVSHATVAAEILTMLGVPRESIVLEPRPRATAEEARYLQERLGDAPFFLITSASHMPRAMFLFQSVGMRPIAAPVNIRDRTPHGFDARRLLPSLERVLEAHEVTHEILGTAWAWIRGARVE